jgi:hypothetical protein
MQLQLLALLASVARYRVRGNCASFVGGGEMTLWHRRWLLPSPAVASAATEQPSSAVSEMVLQHWRYSLPSPAVASVARSATAGPSFAATAGRLRGR